MAAYGDIKHVVTYLNRGDIVFYFHRGVGLIAAAKVIGPPKFEDDSNKGYRKVKFLTPVPSCNNGIQRMMTAERVSQVTGRTFFWARTMKVPYLDRKDAQNLLGELKNILS